MRAEEPRIVARAFARSLAWDLEKRHEPGRRLHRHVVEIARGLNFAAERHAGVASRATRRCNSPGVMSNVCDSLPVATVTLIGDAAVAHLDGEPADLLS